MIPIRSLQLHLVYLLDSGFRKLFIFLLGGKVLLKSKKKKDDRSLSSFGRNYDLNLKRSMAIEKKSPLIVCAR